MRARPSPEDVFAMKLFCSMILFGCGVLALDASAQSWQHQPYYRDDPRYRGGYARQDYGYGRYEQSLVNRVMSDLDQAARHARLDGHEAGHFNEAARSLEEFQSKWARGKFDNRRLDNAIHNLEHLTDADRVHGRDREMLSRDLYDLRQFRASRGRW
jgi:hypothetical protein